MLHTATVTATPVIQRSSIVHKRPSYGYSKLMLCFMDYLPSEGDLAGGGKIKIKVCSEMICITKFKITMIAKYLEDTTSVHSQLANSTFLSHTLSCLCS